MDVLLKTSQLHGIKGSVHVTVKRWITFREKTIGKQDIQHAGSFMR